MTLDRQRTVTDALQRADDNLSCAVEAPDEQIAGPYLRRAIGELILAVETQGKEIADLKASVSAAHDSISAVDQRTIGSTVLGGL